MVSPEDPTLIDKVLNCSTVSSEQSKSHRPKCWIWLDGVGPEHIRRDETGKFAPLAKIKIKKLTGVYPALTPNLIVPLKLYQTDADLRIASINKPYKFVSNTTRWRLVKLY